MRTLYLECDMGAAGDMLTAALLELLPDPAAFVRKLNGLGIPGVRYELETSVKCGITGSHIRVLVNGEEEISDDGHGHEHAHGHGDNRGSEHAHCHGDDRGHSHAHSHAGSGIITPG